MPAFLAVTDQGSRGLAGVVFWSVVLLLLVLVAFAGYTLLRRWMRGDGDDAPGRGAFTLADLRAMHRRGELTDAEFAATKAQLIGSIKGDSTSPRPPPSP